MADFVRDFVGGACDGGNAMSRFVKHADKAGSQRDMWQREFLSHDPAAVFNETSIRGEVPVMNTDFFFQGNVARPQPTMNPYNDFDSVWDNVQQQPHLAHMGPEFRDSNPVVTETIKDFLHSTLHNGPMPLVELHPADTQFSPQQKLQIRNRASGLARHFCNGDPSTKMMEERLATLFKAFGINEQEASVALQENLNIQGAWMNEFANFREPSHLTAPSSFQQFDRVWDRQVLPPPQVSEWVNDYEDNWKDYKGPTLQDDELNQFNKVYDEVKTETAEDWINEFNVENTGEREEEELWFSQFLGGPMVTNQNTQQSWSEEFAASAVPPNPEIGNLTEKISKIQNPKLQQSEFMKFIKQVDAGEIDLNRPQ